MRFTLGRRAQQWNEISRADKTATAKVRHAHTERLCCQLMGQLDPSEIRVLLGIQARTLRFNKFAEAITLAEFCNGFRDVDGDLVLDEDDAPYFAGCNISKTETVSQALTRLERRELITRWRPGHRLAPVYMPFPEEWLANKMAQESAAIAEDYDFVVVQEHFRFRDGRFFKVNLIDDDNSIVLDEVSARLNPNGGDQIRMSAEEWANSWHERLTVEEILTARRHR